MLRFADRPKTRRRPTRSRPSLDMLRGVCELESRVLLTFTIAIDYSLDTNNFFNTQAKRDLMQQAANSLASTISTSLSAISPSGGNTWSAILANPATGADQELTDITIPADTLVVYVGGRSLGGNERGFAGPGGFSWSGTSDWGNVVEGRGQPGALAPTPTAFSPWGGSITFDSAASWFYGTTTAGLNGTQTDFYSVALHELGHVLGVGNTQASSLTSWSRYIVNGTFVGPNATSANGGTPVRLDASGGHWAEGTTSGGQIAAMTPTLIQGTRKVFTPLDLAGLKDIGWQVQVPGTVQFASANVSVPKSSASVSVTVSRPPAGSASTVHVSTVNGTAVAGQDFVSQSFDVSFAQGETSKTFQVPLVANGRGGTRFFGLVLSNFRSAFAGSQISTIVKITDNLAADFDGDGLTDLTVYRPGVGQWLSLESGGGVLNFPFGAPNLVDIPVPGNYDGSTKAEIAVYRPSTGQWLGLLSGGKVMNVTFGAPGVDIPEPGDYDGDGKTDIVVYRPTTGQWLGLLSGGGVLITTFGAPNLVDIPVPGDYDGDGKTDIAVYRPATGRWLSLLSGGGVLNTSFGAPNLVDIPVPGDYDGDGKTDLAIYRPSQGRWIGLLTSGGVLDRQFGAPNLVDIPVNAPIAALKRLGVIPGVSAMSVSPGSSGIDFSPEASVPPVSHAVTASSPAAARAGHSQSSTIVSRVRPGTTGPKGPAIHDRVLPRGKAHHRGKVDRLSPRGA